MPQQPPDWGGPGHYDLRRREYDVRRRIEARRSLARRAASHWRPVFALFVLVAAMGSAGVATNTFGAGDRFEGLVRRIDRFIAGPVPERSTRPTVTVTEPPAPTPKPTPDPNPSDSPPAVEPSASLPPTPTPEPTPTPLPPREPVDVDLLADPGAVFSHQTDRDWCAVAGTQMVLSIHAKADPSVEFQRQLASRIREWESRSDSLNGNWGPAAIALALEAYGVPGYEVRAYESRATALRDAAKAISEMRAPAVLLTWRGAHTWVMTGYRADADPTIFSDAKVTGAYILDPWYPDHSSIWGQSDVPGHFEDEAEMKRNYLPWRRPEGRYPDRDDKFIAVVPTIPLFR